MEDYDKDSRIERAVVALLDTADDTECYGDTIKVSRAALRTVAEEVCDEIPGWLK